jgi:hypothetical protein
MGVPQMGVQWVLCGGLMDVGQGGVQKVTL